MEDKNSKRVYTKEETGRFKKSFEELMNSDYVDDDDDIPTPSESKIKPTPTVAQVVEVLNSHEYEAFDDDVTDCSEQFDETIFYIWMGLHVEPSKVEIISFQTETTFDGKVPYYKVVVEGVENVAKLILALHVDIEDVDNLMDNLFEALANRIPGNWDADYYDPAEIIENLRKIYDIEYKTVKC